MHFFVVYDANSFMPGPDLVYTSKCLPSISYTKCSCKVYLVSKVLVLAVTPFPLVLYVWTELVVLYVWTEQLNLILSAFVLLQYVQLMFM